MIQIKPPQKTCKEHIDLQGHAKGILPGSFVMMVLGRPGSGKSHLISQLLTRSQLYGNKFDRICYFGPTKYEGIEHDQDNTCETVTQQEVEDLLAVLKQSEKEDYHVLFVFDDVIGTLYENRTKSWLSRLVFNRRHVLGTGTLSILFTTQKYTSAPTILRSVTNAIFFSRVTKGQLTTMYRELTLGASVALTNAFLDSLPPHSFIFANLQGGRLYDHKFRLL